jgi:hypothetical protein
VGKRERKGYVATAAGERRSEELSRRAKKGADDRTVVGS